MSILKIWTEIYSNIILSTMGISIIQKIIGLVAIVAIAALSACSGTLKNFYFDTIPNALNTIPH